MTLGQVLREARTNLKLSLRDVERATRGKVSNGYLSLLESGKVDNPSPHHLYHLSVAYNLDYSRLMELSGYKMPRLRSDRSAPAGLAFSGADELTPDQKKQVESFIQFLRSQGS